jgi:hypothetical protein
MSDKPVLCINCKWYRRSESELMGPYIHQCTERLVERTSLVDGTTYMAGQVLDCVKERMQGGICGAAALRFVPARRNAFL